MMCQKILGRVCELPVDRQERFASRKQDLHNFLIIFLLRKFKTEFISSSSEARDAWDAYIKTYAAYEWSHTDAFCRTLAVDCAVVWIFLLFVSSFITSFVLWILLWLGVPIGGQTKNVAAEISCVVLGVVAVATMFGLVACWRKAVEAHHREENEYHLWSSKRLEVEIQKIRDEIDEEEG